MERENKNGSVKRDFILVASGLFLASTLAIGAMDKGSSGCRSKVERGDKVIILD